MVVLHKRQNKMGALGDCKIKSYNSNYNIYIYIHMKNLINQLNICREGEKEMDREKAERERERELGRE